MTTKAGAQLAGFLSLTFCEYIILDLGGHRVLVNIKRHIDRRGSEVNMIKFTVQ